MTLHNWPRQRIVNGERGTLTAIAGSEVSVQFDAGHHLTLPPSYLQAGHLTHAYAMTIHKAQGLTADRCLVLADDTLSREAAYTALSRGRLENRLVVIHPEDPQRDTRHGPPGQPTDPIARLFATLHSSRAKTMAIDTPEPEPTLAPVRRPAPPRPQPRALGGFHHAFRSDTATHDAHERPDGAAIELRNGFAGPRRVGGR